MTKYNNAFDIRVPDNTFDQTEVLFWTKRFQKFSRIEKG